MSTLSPLQLFPLHIVQLIVDHVAGSSRMVYDGVRVNSHEYRTLLKPLLWVCHNLRTVTYSRYCNNFELNLSGMPLAYLDPLHSPDRCTDVDYHGADEDIGVDPLLVEANIGAFVERVKLMAPLVGEISIDPTENEDMPRIASQYFGHLASRLYWLACRIEYNYTLDATDMMRLQLDMICNLTHVSYISTSRIGDAYQFVQLARKNALILQSLVLECEHDIDILGLVQDADGNHVEYPRLLALKLWSASDVEEPRRPAFRDAAPFPILRQLHINLDCSFDDDIFFRGNAATLEWLDMPLDSLSVSILRKYKVFVPGSHPKLQRHWARSSCAGIR
ncbi:hypothetical protein GGH92_006402 [Coemansia sp. RSA 2673]|nr:hypothetical protein GGH92_006402 [Coemansia sp. RSA 2673]